MDDGQPFDKGTFNVKLTKQCIGTRVRRSSRSAFGRSTGNDISFEQNFLETHFFTNELLHKVVKICFFIQNSCAGIRRKITSNNWYLLLFHDI